MRRVFYLGIIIIISSILSSCTTAPIKPPVYLPKEIYPQPTGFVSRHDVFHIVAPGETLWRISKMYDVPMQNILQANSLKNKEELEKGQRLLVPNAAPIVPVIPLYPSRKWKYIIIHHSATDEGSSLYFDKYHQGKGWDGIGYHFVIGNGTKEKEDGQIEVTPRWIKQENGCHCRANNMNEKSIGICLVGNFNKERVSEKQMASLVYLVNLLRRNYRIPVRNILGHGQVRGAKTECPGKKFPWGELKSRLMAVK
jgi:LysM repeat protein